MILRSALALEFILRGPSGREARSMRLRIEDVEGKFCAPVAIDMLAAGKK